MTLRVRVSALCAVAFLTVSAAHAATFDYVTSGGILYRDQDGQTVSARTVGGNPRAPWRESLAASTQSERVTALSCDRAAPVCFANVISANGVSDWQPLKPQGAHAWSDATGFTGSVADIDDAAGLALLIGSPEGRPQPGVYLWVRGDPSTAARLLTPLNSKCINSARFVRSGTEPLVFVSEGCSSNGQGGFWRILDRNGAQVAAIHPPGLPIALEPSAILFLGKIGPNAIDQTIYRFSVPSGQPAKWIGGPIYVPSRPEGRPSIVHTGSEPFPTSAALLDDHHLLAVAVGGGAAQLVGLCTVNNVTRSVDLSLQVPNAPEAARLAVEGDDGYAVVSEWDLWGRRQQYLLSIETGAKGPCEGDVVAVTALPRSDKPDVDLGPISITRASVAADDGENVPYSVLSRPGSHGPVLVTAYGASDLPVYGMAALPVEQSWIQRGGRLVIVTVRGDAREPPWRNSSHGDYQTRAAKDLNAVVQTLVSQDGGHTPVTLVGASAGAVTAARATLLRPDLYAAAVLVSGPLDLSLNPPQFGPPSGGFAEWFSGSQHSDAACGSVQFFIYQGGKDDRVSPQNAVDFARYIGSLGYHGAVQADPNMGHYVLEDPASAAKILSDLDAWGQVRAACPRHRPTGTD